MPSRPGSAGSALWWGDCTPPLNSNHLRAEVPSHSGGTVPKVTVPSPPPPPRETERTCDTKQNMPTRGQMNQKMTRKLPVGMHVQLY